jgi:hypothetical protein
MIFYTSKVMSRTDKMITSWVVHLVFDKTIKDISNMNIIFYSRHKKLTKKLFGKVMTIQYPDLNSILWKITSWKFRVLRKRYKTSFFPITFDLENRFLQTRCLWFRITKLQMKKKSSVAICTFKYDLSTKNLNVSAWHWNTKLDQT